MPQAVAIEVYAEAMDPRERQNLTARNAFFANVGRVSPLPEREPVRGPAILGPGNYPGGRVPDGSDVTGNGAPVCGQLEFIGQSVIRGVVLKDGAVVRNGAMVRLIDCDIRAPVVVDAGGILIVVGSRWLNQVALCMNAGAPANCVSAANIGWNPGPTPHVNTTVIGEAP